MGKSKAKPQAKGKTPVKQPSIASKDQPDFDSETTFASSHDSNSEQETITSASQSPLISLPKPSETQPKTSSSQRLSEEKLKTLQVDDDDEYLPMPTRRYPDGKRKFKISGQLKAKASHPPVSKKTKTIKKDPKKTPKVSTSCQSETYQFLESYDAEFRPQTGLKIDSQPKGQENNCKQSSNLTNCESNAERMEKLLNSKPVFTVKFDEKSNQTISMEIYTKLLKSYQELLNEKLENDLNYMKRMNSLVSQNADLFKQKQFYKAKCQTQNYVKIEQNSAPQDDSILRPLEDQLMLQTAHTNFAFKPMIKSEIEGQKLRSNIFFDKRYQNIKLQPKFSTKNEQIQLETENKLAKSREQSGEFGYLSSFQSQEQNEGFLDSREKIVEEKMECQIEKKLTQTHLQKDFSTQSKQNKNINSRSKRISLKRQQLQSPRETYFERRRRNNQHGKSDSSENSQKSPEKSLYETFKHSSKDSSNRYFKYYENKRGQEKRRWDNPWKNFRKNERPNNWYEKRVSPIKKFERKPERLSPKFSDEQASQPNQKLSLYVPEFSYDDEKDIEY